MVLIIICCSILGFILIINKDNNIEIQVKDIHPIGAYNNPIIPKGFKKVETVDASWELINGIPKGWNNGLVIEDEIGNQFVWVPVNIQDEEYIKISNESDKYYKINDISTNVKEENQILKYGGFYISRYEAGVPDLLKNNYTNISENTNNIEGIPVSKKDNIVWNYISWNKAKNNAITMYKDSNSVESNLISYKQLNSLRYWLYKHGYNLEDNKEWGNYSNTNFIFTGWYSTDYGKTYIYGKDKLKAQYNMILSTGATERNKSNNIYDLAGNVMEYMDVIEKQIKNNKVQRYICYGGYYDNINEYDFMNAYGISSKQGFRIILYNK